MCNQKSFDKTVIYNLLSTFRYTISLESDNTLGKKESSYFYSCFTAYEVEAQGHCGPNEPASWDAGPCDVPSHIDSGFGYVTSFGQWDISKLSESKRCLISPCTLGFAF